MNNPETLATFGTQVDQQKNTENVENMDPRVSPIGGVFNQFD